MTPLTKIAEFSTKNLKKYQLYSKFMSTVQVWDLFFIFLGFGGVLDNGLEVQSWVRIG